MWRLPGSLPLSVQREANALACLPRDSRRRQPPRKRWGHLVASLWINHWSPRKALQAARRRNTSLSRAFPLNLRFLAMGLCEEAANTMQTLLHISRISFCVCYSQMVLQEAFTHMLIFIQGKLWKNKVIIIKMIQPGNFSIHVCFSLFSTGGECQGD